MGLMVLYWMFEPISLYMTGKFTYNYWILISYT